jgi:hypothetical protein
VIDTTFRKLIGQENCHNKNAFCKSEYSILGTTERIQKNEGTTAARSWITDPGTAIAPLTPKNTHSAETTIIDKETDTRNRARWSTTLKLRKENTETDGTRK